jgi:hypothetical protein
MAARLIASIKTKKGHRPVADHPAETDFRLGQVGQGRLQAAAPRLGGMEQIRR